MSSTLGVALRELCGDKSTGEGPVEVMTRLTDFNITEVQNAQGQRVNAPVNSLVSFTAATFREVGEDVWEFRVPTTPAPNVPPVTAVVYLRGDDIFLIRRFSKVVG